MRIPVILCFDVEPDEREVAREARPWLGFERLLDRIEPLRDELARVTGRPVLFSWFLRMDPQIADSHGHAAWVTERYGERIQALRTAGDVVGLHPHCARWSQQRNRWVADHGDPDWVDECIRVSFEAYQAVFGEACRAIRYGDRFLSGRAIRLAAQLGARIDLTVEPGMRGGRSLLRGSVATGRIPNQTMAPRVPYRPSADDPLRRAATDSAANDPDLWMIPLTAINSDPLIPLWRRIGRRVRNPRSPRHRTATLPAPCRAQQYWSIIDQDLRWAPRPYLAFATRTDTFIRPLQMAAFDAKLASLRDWPPAGRWTFTTPAAVVEAMTASVGSGASSG